jgi:hypothetical protein
MAAFAVPLSHLGAVWGNEKGGPVTALPPHIELYPNTSP